jgi:predicted RNase H-like HicB family nuclease
VEEMPQMVLSKRKTMERIVNLHIEKLREGLYLATSEDVQGLIAQGRTIEETLEIAKDVAKKLIEAQTGEAGARLLPAREAFDYPLIINA